MVTTHRFPRDHPRIRGEHIQAGFEECFRVGSSPHTRGAPYRVHGDAMATGIIPAYAGSTGCSATPPPSPGIIPAYAGSTMTVCWVPSARRDHPRIRGEHFDLLRVLDGLAGSSPHTRGAPEHPAWVQRPGGIIPAYAGSTRNSNVLTEMLTDHPRIRGEHGRVLGNIGPGYGSSPHTRGAPSKSPQAGSDRRIIPAYAGSTDYAKRAPQGLKDHPRIRGEHAQGGIGKLKQGGSSPHTRGARADYPRPCRPTWDHPRIRGEHSGLARVDP